MRDTGNVRSNPSEILGVGTGSGNGVGYRRDYESHREYFFGRKSVSGISAGCQPKPEESGLRHQLSAGQMAMVAVGGSIGTGLLLGSAAALEIAGPGVILSFILAAFITLTVTLALGELSSVHPAAGSFGVYGDLYLNQWAGFIARAGYWAAISISIGAELIASATYLTYWFPSVPALFWVLLFSVLLLLINLRSVGNYARFEYWFAMIKVATIAAFVLLGAGLLLSGRVTAQYTAHGGFLPRGALAPLLAMGFALYTFGGLEFVAITSGESRSAQEIPRAIKLTFTVLASVYLGAIVILVGVMPWNRAGVTESPFVTVFRHAHVPAASHIMTFVILTAALFPEPTERSMPLRASCFLWHERDGRRRLSDGSVHRDRQNRHCWLRPTASWSRWCWRSGRRRARSFRFLVRRWWECCWPGWFHWLRTSASVKQISPSQLAGLPMRSPLGAWGSALGFPAYHRGNLL